MNKKYILLTVVILIIAVAALKFYNSTKVPEVDIAALHAPNQDYYKAIELAKQNKEPMFIEFYGEF